MNNEEILEGNKLIAQFMDVKNVVEFRMKKNPEIIDLVMAEDEDGYIDYVEGINYILYHSDWNQLMSVVEKIETIEDCENENFVVNMFEKTCEIVGKYCDYQHPRHSLYVSIEDVDKKTSTYKAVIEFIKWYNKTNKQ